jgi:hypothetical protein
MSVVVKPRRKTGPLAVMYVEVNDANFLNSGCYSLTTGEPLFDIAIIFAANINYDVQSRRAVLSLNQNVSEVCLNASTYIRPLQEKGIKVLLSILGNHQGAGFLPQEVNTQFRILKMRSCTPLYSKQSRQHNCSMSRRS